MIRVIGRGLVVGENHHRAKLSDHEVELIRQLRDEGMHLADIAEKFEIAKSTACYICNFQRRAYLASDWVRK
jgi:hypothetical protein